MMANTPSAKEKIKALDLALQQIEKQFGKGAIMKLGEERANVAVEVIPTGSIGLDLALGVGGVPRGRIVEIYGPESSGKTTLALTIIANAQRMGGNAVFIDAEHALDAAYAQKLGVDINNLHVAQPDTGEEALEIAVQLRPEVVLLDIGMPKLNGFEVAKQIREQEWGQTVTLIALSGWGQEEDRRRSKEAGFDYHLIKPVEIAHLEKLLASLVAG